MKKNSLAITLLACLVFTTSNAQKFSGPDKSPMDAAAYPTSHKVTDKLVKITYSRPQLKGRSVAELAPEGAVWRTGANEAVEITFYKDINFGGTLVPKGTYSLFTIPGAKEWTIILNSNLNQWGAYEYDEAADIVRVKGSVKKGEESLEEFSMAFKEAEDTAEFFIGWGTVRVAVPFGVAL